MHCVSRSVILAALVVLGAAAALAKPLERRDVSDADIAAAKANNSAVVYSVTGSNGQYTLSNKAAGTSVGLQSCNGNAIPDSAVATGDDFVAFFLPPDITTGTTCYFYDSTALDYAPGISQAVSNPTPQNALLGDSSKTVVCLQDVEQSPLPVCYDITGTTMTFARFYSQDTLNAGAGQAGGSTQYTTSSDLADAINSGGPVPAGESYPEVPAYLNTNTSVYDLVIFNTTDNYYIGTNASLVFSIPFALSNAYYKLAVELWSTIGSQTGSESRMIQSFANVTTADAINGSHVSWSVDISTTVPNVSETTNTSASQINYFISVYGRRSVDGPNAVPDLPWDPVYYGIFEKVFTQ